MFNPQITDIWHLYVFLFSSQIKTYCLWSFSKALDTVGRTWLWQLLRKYGCPEKLTAMIEALSTGLMANVNVGREVSESFSVTNQVMQGCVLAHTLFSVFLSASNAWRGFPRHGEWRLHIVQTECWHIQRRTLQSEDSDYSDTDELLFADDSAQVAHSAEEMQKIVDALSDASKMFRLKINIKKTQVLYQPNSTRIREEDVMADETKWTLFLNSPTSEALYQVMDASTMKYRGGWARSMHLSADYARDSGTTTTCGLKARYTVQSCCPPSYTEPKPVQCTGDRWTSCMPSWCDICVQLWG